MIDANMLYLSILGGAVVGLVALAAQYWWRHRL